MKGWHNESQRHSLASRGIRTRAIPNPVASEDLYWQPTKLWYLYEVQKGETDTRDFRGSGLEGIYKDDVMDIVWKVVKNMEKRLGVPVVLKDVFLSGSRVTGFWNEDSDLDVSIVVEPKDIESLLVSIGGRSQLSWKINDVGAHASNDLIETGESFVMDDNGNEIDVQINSVYLYNPDVDKIGDTEMLLWRDD